MSLDCGCDTPPVLPAMLFYGMHIHESRADEKCASSWAEDQGVMIAADVAPANASSLCCRLVDYAGSDSEPESPMPPSQQQQEQEQHKEQQRQHRSPRRAAPRAAAPSAQPAAADGEKWPTPPSPAAAAAAAPVAPVGPAESSADIVRRMMQVRGWGTSLGVVRPAAANHVPAPITTFSTSPLVDCEPTWTSRSMTACSAV
jgi:hypothetical protein